MSVRSVAVRMSVRRWAQKSGGGTCSNKLLSSLSHSCVKHFIGFANIHIQTNEGWSSPRSTGQNVLQKHCTHHLAPDHKEY